MNILSMTGFARQTGEIKTPTSAFDFCFELKSVNAKGLDVKIRLPLTLEGLECTLKTKISQKFSRGTISVSLNLQNQNSCSEIKIDADFLGFLAQNAKEIYLSDTKVFEKPSPAELLNVSGVIKHQDTSLSEDSFEALKTELSKAFDEALEKLYQDRLSEGEKMCAALLKTLDDIELKTLSAEKIAFNAAETIRQKVLAQVEECLSNTTVSPERLEQEVLFYVLRADVKEETDRLKAHVLSAREIFKNGGAVGRRLDFLCQELNREANTLCSKSMDLDLTKAGMDLKALIEQFREQVQNME